MNISCIWRARILKKQQRVLPETQTRLSESCYWTSIKAQDVSDSHLTIPNLNRRKTVHMLLITCLLSLPAVFLYLTTFSAVCKSRFSLLLVIPTDHTICFRAPLVTCSALYPNIHSVYSRPSLFSTPLVISMHPASVALLPLSMLCVGLHSSLRWNCLPSHENSPCNTLVCDVSVCACVFHFHYFFPLMVLPCSAVKLGPQWEFRKGIIEAVTLWIWGNGFNILYCTVFDIDNIDYYCHCVLLMVL